MEITEKLMKWINHINSKISSMLKELKKKLKNAKNNFVKKILHEFRVISKSYRI